MDFSQEDLLIVLPVLLGILIMAAIAAFTFLIRKPSDKDKTL